jgi:hypothetical protein
VPFDKPLDPTSPQTDDAEARMRRNLGLNTGSNLDPIPSSPTDPMKAARQAIRSHTAAREYAERQLVHAEATIQDLRTKLHHARREKDAAAEAARLAGSRKATAEHTLIATEATLTAERAARDRGDRALREAQVTIRDLQGRLDGPAQGLETAKAELAAERQARQKAEVALREATAADPTTERHVKVVIAESNQPPSTTTLTEKRRRGRPPRAIEVMRGTSESDQPEGSSKTAEPDQDEAVPTVRRPVGRPRKTASVRPVKTSDRPTGRAPAFTAITSEVAGKLQAKGRGGAAEKQQPVQWWVKGWNRRVK